MTVSVRPPAPARALTLSVLGAKHERTGKPCQDAHGQASRGAATAVALADGHGTAARGEIGAALAVAVALEHVLGAAEHLGQADAAFRREHTAELFRTQVRRQLVRDWLERVEAHARTSPAEPPVDPRAYGTTLLFALLTDDDLVVGQLGDGDVLVVTDDGRVHRPLPPEPLAFAGETPSMCEAHAWLRLRIAFQPRPETAGLVCLMTDGYTNAYATDADLDDVARGYARLLEDHGFEAVERALPGFLSRVTRDGSGDDVSLALLHWPGGSPALVCPPNPE
jgi:hypothetical protein